VLSGTATKKIINKFSSNQFGLEHIQADISIQGRNSCGTLLDKNENVVGISYAGISSDDQTSIRINHFIPIMDVLEKLTVSFKRSTLRLTINPKR
jgi:S1-C subfamily serine protease